MNSFLFDDWASLGRTVVVGALAYVALVTILRISGKRTLAKMNAFDLVVTVALGSTLATILLSPDTALAEGVVAIALLCGAQFVVANLVTRWQWARQLAKSDPVLLLSDGRLRRDALERERIAEDEVRQAIRASGCGAVEDVAAVVLETDGTLSVVTRAALGTGSALDGVWSRAPVDEDH